MFHNNELMHMAFVANVVFRKTQDSYVAVKKQDQASEETVVLPEKSMFWVRAVSAWRNLSQLVWIGQMTGKSRKFFSNQPTSSKPGTAGFESSKRRALDRANSWTVPKAVQVRSRGAHLGVEQSVRVQPIEPVMTCTESASQGEHATVAAPENSSAVSEEHHVRETVSTRS